MALYLHGNDNKKKWRGNFRGSVRSLPEDHWERFFESILPEEKRKFSQALSGWSQNQLNYPFPSLTPSPVSPNFTLIIFKVQKRAYILILKRKPGAPGLHKTCRQHLLSPLGCRQDHTQAFLNGWTFFKFPSGRSYYTPSVSTNLR